MAAKTSKVETMRALREAQSSTPAKGSYAYHRAEAKKHFSQMRTSALAAAHELKVIRDQRLYLEQYHTFDAFVQSEFGIKKSQAYRLIDGAEIAISLSPRGDIAPVNEGQVRPLKSLPKEQRQEAWDQAVDQAGGAPSHRVVKAVVKDMRADPIDEEPEDDIEVDPIAEWEATQRELEEAQRIIESQAKANQTAAEVERLHAQIRAMESRLEQVMATNKSNEDILRYKHRQLEKVRSFYGVEDYSDIVREAERKDATLRQLRELFGVQTDDEIVTAAKLLMGV